MSLSVSDFLSLCLCLCLSLCLTHITHIVGRGETHMIGQSDLDFTNTAQTGLKLTAYTLPRVNYPFVNQTRPCLSPPSRCILFFITLMEIDFSFPLPYLPRGQSLLIGAFPSPLELQPICGRTWNTVLTDKQRKLTSRYSCAIK